MIVVRMNVVRTMSEAAEVVRETFACINVN
jgi:hypothetical protein